jgi:hypothetical protein
MMTIPELFKEHGWLTTVPAKKIAAGYGNVKGRRIPATRLVQFIPGPCLSVISGYLKKILSLMCWLKDSKVEECKRDVDNQQATYAKK